jgi:arabinogalactan endo-1,4-beta-galactosidase
VATFFYKLMPLNKIVFAVLSAPVILFSCTKSPAQLQATANPVPVVYDWHRFVMGADLSYVNQVQDYGGVYRDSGVVRDPFSIFKAHGANLVRVRLWNNPQWVAPLNGGRLYSDLYDAEKTLRRAKQAGMAVSLDLHYSDTWADDHTQVVPAAWAGLGLAVLRDSVYNFTLSVLNYFSSKGLTPEMIQVGNETNNGILWPVGKTSGTDFTSFCVLLQSGIKAVRDFSATSSIKPLIILHVAQLQNAENWAANIHAGGVTDFDIIGLSHYSKWSTVNVMSDITGTIGRLKAAYGKQVMIVETAYPFTTQNADSYTNVISGEAMVNGYPVTPAGQYQYMKDLTQAVISGGGSGIMYWEPAWITSSLRDLWGQGSSAENCAFFDFGSNTLPVMGYLTWPYVF